MIYERNSQVRNLRHELTSLARGGRLSVIPKDALLTLPQSEREDAVLFEGDILKRKRIVLLTQGCSVATCTMCPLPSEALDPKRQISDEDVMQQFDSSFRDSSVSDYDLITVYTNGNWFVDAEVFPSVRDQIYQRVGDSNASVLAVESLPQFITPDKLKKAKDSLGGKKLSVAIGFQSSDDTIRELAVNSTCTKNAFEQGVSLLKESNYIPQVFLMIKPPFVTEKEGIEDALESIRYLSELDIQIPILCPTRIAPNTVLSKLYQSGEYKPLWLWSVIEVLRRSQFINPDSSPRIVTSELRAKANPNSIPAQNCDVCTDDIIEKIDRFNISRDFRELNSTTCACKSDYLREVALEESTPFYTLPERVGKFLDRQANDASSSFDQSKTLVVFSR